jgi:RNA polymerase sigma-70 factor (ECF subfamily)
MTARAATASLTLPQWNWRRRTLTVERRTCNVWAQVSEPARAKRFDEFARTHEPMLYAMALKLTGSPADARDLVQDAFVRALKAYDTLPAGSNERGWIVTILHNLFIDQCRKRRREPLTQDVHETPVAAPEPAPAAPAWLDITPEQLNAALARVGEEFRVVYVLHTVENKSYKEIAAKLEIPMATVGTRLIRARRKLKALLMPQLAKEAGDEA